MEQYYYATIESTAFWSLLLEHNLNRDILYLES